MNNIFKPEHPLFVYCDTNPIKYDIRLQKILFVPVFIYSRYLCNITKVRCLLLLL